MAGRALRRARHQRRSGTELVPRSGGTRRRAEVPSASGRESRVPRRQERLLCLEVGRSNRILKTDQGPNSNSQLARAIGSWYLGSWELTNGSTEDDVARGHRRMPDLGGRLDEHRWTATRKPRRRL